MSWKKVDQANSIPEITASLIKKSNTRQNADGMYKAEDASSIPGAAYGVFPKSNSWVIRKTGTGGRSGRVQEEILQAYSSSMSLVPDTPWKRPSRPDGTFITLPTNYYSVNHSGQDVVLKGPETTRTSSMQVLGAKSVTMYAVDTQHTLSGGTANFIRDVSDFVWIEGFDIRISSGEGDVFKAGGNVGSNAAPTAVPIVTFVNGRISGVRGTLASVHSDGYQADFHSQQVRMFNVIIETSYQAVFFDPTAANVASRPIIKQGTDLRHCAFRLVEYDGFTDLNNLIYYGDNVEDVLAGPDHIADDVTVVVPTGFDPLQAIRPMTGATLNTDGQGQYITLSPSLAGKITDGRGNPAKFRVAYDEVPARYVIPTALGYELPPAD